MRPLRSILDVVLAGLSLWAAWYHTPAGALLRIVSAHVFGTRSESRPLLAYYSAGTLGARLPENIVPRPPLAPAAALGAGAAGVLGRVAPAERERILARAHARSTNPEELSNAIGRLSAQNGSREAGVLALFCGGEAAQFAVGRAGRGASLEDLARELPPSYERSISLAGETLTLGTAYALSWPVSSWAHVTSPFGVRDHPVLGGRRLHAGVDLGVPAGTAVHAVGPGIVRRASEDAVSGLALVIDHGSGVSTVYFHNDKLLVHKGDHVEQGQIISRSGNTGRSTGPHLHYQLDLPSGPVDPLRFRTVQPRRAMGGGSDL